MKRGHVFALIATSWIVPSVTLADGLYERAGWVATIPTGVHSVQAVVTIVDERTLYVEHLTYDGTAPAVYFYLGEKNTNSSFSNGLEVPPLLDRAYNNETLTLTLPPGETLDGYGAISIWCAIFSVNFSSASFQPPAATYDRAGWVAQLPSGAHQVQGRATIITERIIRVENFTYDGTAPAVYFYLGGNNTYQAFLNGIAIGPELDRAFSNETVVVALPEGDTLDPYTAISVWCAEFNVNFSSAQFKLDIAQDYDNDGDIDLDDHAIFLDCLAGPGAAPNPSMTTAQACLTAFDMNTDGAVDLHDYAAFQRVFTGPPPSTVQYELVFDATWSAATHPQDFPAVPHFSELIGGTHNANASFWQVGGIASAGMEAMAEVGATTPLDNEVQAEVTAGNADQVILGPWVPLSPDTVSLDFTVTRTYSKVTMVTMIAPSPDWFVGVSGYDLFVDNQWTPEIIIPLPPYDAGTDSGTTYTSPNADTNPQDPISAITGFPFYNSPDRPPLGTFTFRRID